MSETAASGLTPEEEAALRKYGTRDVYAQGGPLWYVDDIDAKLLARELLEGRELIEAVRDVLDATEISDDINDSENRISTLIHETLRKKTGLTPRPVEPEPPPNTATRDGSPEPKEER